MKPVVGIVVALPAEGRALAGWTRWQRIGKRLRRHVQQRHDITLIYVRAGVGAEHAQEAAQWLVADGANALVSIGVAGGVSPAINTGDLVIAETVVEQGDGKRNENWVADTAYTDFAYTAISRADIPVHRGRVFTSRQALLTDEKKKHWHEQTQALIVDMESSAIAWVAQETHLPFFVMRAVSDNSTASVPQDVYACLTDSGTVKLSLLFCALLRRPALITDLLRMKKDFDAALRALAHGWLVLANANLPNLLVSKRLC